MSRPCCLLGAASYNIIIKDPGEYFLEVYNNQGCIGRDTFLLQTSADLLKARLAMPTQAFAGDTVVMIDVSWPLPENIAWTYPDAMSTLVDNGDIVFGQFDDAGTYAITLNVTLGECRDQMTKTINILERENGDIGGRLGYEKFVVDFTLYPNANNGSFNVGVELLEESPITLSVWNTVTQHMVGRVSERGVKRSYLLHVDMRPLSSGTYLLRLDHARGTEYIRFNVY
jgi:hypothetical protein